MIPELVKATGLFGDLDDLSDTSSVYSQSGTPELLLQDNPKKRPGSQGREE